MMLTLEFPNNSHKGEYNRLISEWSKIEEIPTSPSRLFDGEDFDDFLAEVEKDITDNKYGVNSHLFFCMKESNILGAIQIRHSIDHPNLVEVGGHIGYGIAPMFRKRGYGTEILSLGLEEAQKLGLKRVLITADTDNIGSWKNYRKEWRSFGEIDRGLISKEILD